MDTAFGLAVISRDSIPGYYSVVRERLNAILGNEYSEAIKLIEKNKAAIDALVSELIAKNHLRGPEIDEIIKNNIVE